MAKVETVTLAEIGLSNYELDGSLDKHIADLMELRDEAVRRGLVNVQISTDYVDEPVYEYGGYQGNTEKKWTMIVAGEKRSPTKFKTKLPKAQYNSAFQQGLEAAQNGLERDCPADGSRWGEAWLDGFDSHESETGDPYLRGIMEKS